ELELLHAGHARGGDALAGGHRSGERDRGDVGMPDERFAYARPASHDKVEHARRNARRGDDLRQRMRSSRHEVGRLEHDAVAVRERRRDLPRGNRDREITRRDEPDDPDRFTRDLDVDARAHGCDLLAAQPHAFGGEEQEDLAGAYGLAYAFGECLAFLAREQPAELVLASEDLVADSLQYVVTLM